MSFPYRITPKAWREIARALDRSAREFGYAARDRYEALIFTAITDIAANPLRVESRAKPNLGRGARSWHLRLSRARARTPTGMVKAPRHVIFYRVETGVVIIERVMHDASNIPRHFSK